VISLKQVKFYIDEEHYEKLKKLAEEQGPSVPAYVKNIVLRALGESEPGLDKVVKKLGEMLDQLAKEVGRIGVDLALYARKVDGLERELRREPQKAFESA